MQCYSSGQHTSPGQMLIALDPAGRCHSEVTHLGAQQRCGGAGTTRRVVARVAPF